MNGQNIPEEVQGVFEAGEGHVIIKADYSNIEYRVMAILTGEDWLIKEFDKGVNFHDINTRLLFGIEKEDPTWHLKRRVAKAFAFGLFFGSTVEGMFSNITSDIPEFQFTLSQFKILVANYMSKMPKYAKWAEAQRKKGRETRCVETAFGFHRFLLGDDNTIERQALNTPVQGTAGQVTEEAIITLDKVFLQKEAWGAKMILTVHDSILVECKKAYQEAVCQTVKEVMEKEYQINGYTVKFPVDIEVGPSWGETEKVEVVCPTPKRSRTH